MPLKHGTSSSENISRRKFVKVAGLAATAFSIVPRHILGGTGYRAPSDTLYVAGIGVGGKGESDIASFAKSGKAQISFLCDVDDRRAAKSVAAFPKAKYYKDFRVMLDKEHKHIDAVSVSTPDHNHAVQAMAAMQLGKHVYVQKPLTHDIYEARMLTEAAKKYKVVTQMGNQGPRAMVYVSSPNGTTLALLATCTPFIAGPTDLCGPKELHGRNKRQRCRKNWIGIYGWEQHLTKITLKKLFLSTGVAGGIMVQVRWVIWPVILLSLHSEFSD